MRGLRGDRGHVCFVSQDLCTASCSDITDKERRYVVLAVFIKY